MQVIASVVILLLPGQKLWARQTVKLSAAGMLIKFVEGPGG